MPESEADILRARVAELERERIELVERTGAAIAAAEDRLYWLDRWNVDLDRLMQRRSARWAFRLTQLARRVKRRLGR